MRKGKIPKNIKLLHKKAVKFKKGNIPWNKGKKVDRIIYPNLGHFKQHSEETKRMISEATKKAMADSKIRAKISESKKGSAPWNKGKKLPQISGEKHPMFGKTHSEETKNKMVAAVKKRVSNPTFLKKLSEIHKKRLSNPKERERQSKVSRETILNMYKSGSFPKQTHTKIEIAIKEELKRRGYKEGIDFIHQYLFMNKFMCDFCFPKQKIIIEAYGDFWHANPKKYSGRKLHAHQIKGINRDKAKEAYIKKVDNNSWTYLYLWESDIKEDVFQCVNKIEEALNKNE